MQAIAQLKEGDSVEETYLAATKQIATARNGVTYLSIKLADKTGEIAGRLWDNAEHVAGKFQREDFVRIKGIVASYQGMMQIKMKSLEKVDDAAVDIANFVQAASREPDEMVQELRAALAGIGNTNLNQLMQAFLNDASFMESFKRAPAAKALHHNYVGGLIEHVLELINLCRDVAKHFPAIDTDLLVAGAFIHDIGKTHELSIRKTIEYTTEGRLLGHISLGYEMLVEKIAGIPGFPEETAMLLRHIMLSHHGQYAFGSPKRPKIQEAVVINYLDDLSAKINNFQATLEKENVEEGAWSAYNKMHDRYLYRQSLSPDSAASAHEPESVQDDANAQSSGKLPLDI